MIRFLRQYFAHRRLNKLVERECKSFRCEQFRRHRAAALKYSRGLKGVMAGASASRPGHSAEPEPIFVVSAVPGECPSRGAYYNENDPFAAAWLRELIKAGLIAPGVVDERSIEDVRPDELAGFVQCHFFAGIGVWSLALRQAGWPDDRPVWTGSCPCQPFSAAGKGGGFDDERHLWPAFHWLIEQSAPPIVLGEQVASKDGLAWLNLVSADLEATGYAFGAVDTCAAGFGAPHIRQRLYWMADAESARRREQSGRLSRAAEASAGEVAGQGHGDAARADGAARVLADTMPAGRAEGRTGAGRGSVAGCGFAVSLANTNDTRLEGRLDERECAGERAARPRSVGCGLADADGGNAGTERQQRSGEQRQQPQDGGAGGMGFADCGHAGRDTGASFGSQGGPVLRAVGDALGAPGADDRPGPLNGLWQDADWLCCTDGKWRPVAPGTFPLAPTGTVRNRVGLLRGAGNAINLAQAQGFIEAVLAIAGEARSGETVQQGSTGTASTRAEGIAHTPSNHPRKAA